MKKTINLLVALLFCTVGSAAFAQTVLYVKSNATGANNGSSWTNAYTSLVTALAASTAGTDIWVASGTYQPTSGSSFFLKEGVGIYGGFSGIETVMTQRNSDPATNATILKGNGHSVVRSGSVTITAVLDGFTVRDGSSPVLGGGIHNSSASPTLKNLIVTNNTISNATSGLGGGINNTNGSSPIMTNIVIKNNTAPSGGGLMNYDHSNAILTNVKITGNTATAGVAGGMYSSESDIVMVNVEITGNTAQAVTASHGVGGGMYSSSCNLSMTNVIISGNTSAKYGAGIFSAYGTAVMVNVLINNNTCNTLGGGGMFNLDVSPDMTNVTIASNTAAGTSTGGGGIYNNGNSDPIIKNSIIYNNKLLSAVNNIANTAGTAIPEYRYSLIQGSGGSSSWVSTFGTNGGNNIDVNPLFVSTTDFHLQAGSPALNAGSNALYTGSSTDLGGGVRFNGIIDLGVYEVQPPCVPTNSTLTATACTSYTLNAQTYTTSGTYTQLRQNVAGCDSTITLNLTIGDAIAPVASLATLANVTAQCSVASLTAPTAIDNCAGTIAGTTTVAFPITTPGTTIVTWTYTDGNGNTATQTQNVIITLPVATTTQTGPTITAIMSGAAYQWINCAGNTPIAGATAQSFTPTADGSYAVIVTQNGCSSTSACVVINTVGMEELPVENRFSVYPNPNAGSFIVTSGKAITLTIRNATGQLISTQQLQSGSNTLQLEHAESGIYFLSATDENGQRSLQRVSVIK